MSPTLRSLCLSPRVGLLCVYTFLIHTCSFYQIVNFYHKKHLRMGTKIKCPKMEGNIFLKIEVFSMDQWYPCFLSLCPFFILPSLPPRWTKTYSIIDKEKVL